MSQKAPANTSEQVAKNPLGMLLDMASEVKPGDAILRQEAAGQQSLVMSDTIPNMTNAKRVDFEEMGIVFGEVVPGDDLFVYVTLPGGWQKVATDGDSRFSNLVDDKGRVRANIFYKAAFYDRRASITPARRFSVVVDYEFEDANSAIKSNVKDGKEVVFTSEAYAYPAEQKYTGADYEAATRRLMPRFTCGSKSTTRIGRAARPTGTDLSERIRQVNIG